MPTANVCEAVYESGLVSASQRVATLRRQHRPCTGCILHSFNAPLTHVMAADASVSVYRSGRDVRIASSCEQNNARADLRDLSTDAAGGQITVDLAGGQMSADRVETRFGGSLRIRCWRTAMSSG